jgi:hypothetical protein
MGDSEETAEVIPEKIPTDPEFIPQAEPPVSEKEKEAHARALRNSCTCGGTEPHGHS